VIIHALKMSAFILAACLTAGTLTDAEFEKLHKEIRPPKDELWRTIPWKISLLESRETAAREKKPMFVWVASGEPLGCG